MHITTKPQGKSEKGELHELFQTFKIKCFQ